MDKRHLTGAFAVVIAVAVGIGMILGGSIVSQGVQVNLSETPTYIGRVVIMVEKPSGKTTYETHNIVTTIGKTRVLNYLENGTSGAENYTRFISLSNDDTPLDSWTNLPNALTGSGMARALGTISSENADTYIVSNKFTASGTITVQCSGLNWALENSASLWAAVAFSQVTLNSGDNITITWTVTHS